MSTGASDEDGRRKRSKGSDAGKGGGKATAGNRGKGNADVLMDFDDADVPAPIMGASRTVKKKLFLQAELAHRSGAERAPDAPSKAAEQQTAAESSDGVSGEAHMDVDEECLFAEHRVAKNGAASGENEHSSDHGQPAADSEQSPQQEDSPSEKENRRRSPCGKAGGLKGALKNGWKSRKPVDGDNLQQIADAEAS